MRYSRFFFLFLVSVMMYSEQACSYKPHVTEGPYCCCSVVLFAQCKPGDHQHCCSEPNMKPMVQYNLASNGYACGGTQMSGDIKNDRNTCKNP